MHTILKHLSLIFFILLLCISNNCLAEDNIILNLNLTKIKEIILQNNPKLKAANSETKNAKSILWQTICQWLPHLYFKANSRFDKNNPHKNNKSDENVPSYIPSDFQELYKALLLPSESEQYSSAISLGLKQMLFDSGKIGYDILISNMNIDLAILNEKNLKIDLICQATKTYFELLQINTELKKNKLLLKEKKDKYKTEKDKLDLEIITKTEFDREKLELELLKLEYARLEHDLNIKKNMLFQLLNIRKDTANIEIDMNWSTANYKDIFRKENNPELLIRKNALDIEQTIIIQKEIISSEIEKLKICLAKVDSKAQLTLNGAYSFQKTNEDFQESIRELNNNSAIWIECYWPFFNGFETLNKVNAAKDKYKASKYKIEDAKNELTALIKRNQLNLEIAKRETQILDQKENQKKREYLDFKNKFAQKSISAQVLNSKESELKIASLEKQKMIFAYYIKKAELKKIMNIQH